nr:MAK10-like protein [Tanacetum cinerariifolium]
MGDQNLIRTLGGYSRQSHVGYRNTIKLRDGNNLVPPRSKTICTYSKESLIMALIFGSKSKSFMTMSIPPQGKPSIKQLVAFVDYAFSSTDEAGGGSHSNLKIPCNIGHVHVEKAYIDLNSLINVMTRMQYNWIMRKQLEPREDLKNEEDKRRGVEYVMNKILGLCKECLELRPEYLTGLEEGCE